MYLIQQQLYKLRRLKNGNRQPEITILNDSALTPTAVKLVITSLMLLQWFQGYLFRLQFEVCTRSRST